MGLLDRLREWLFGRTQPDAADRTGVDAAGELRCGICGTTAAAGSEECPLCGSTDLQPAGAAGGGERGSDGDGEESTGPPGRRESGRSNGSDGQDTGGSAGTEPGPERTSRPGTADEAAGRLNEIRDSEEDP